MIELPRPDLLALAGGESVIAFVPRGALEPGDEVGLGTGPSRSPAELKPAYARWADAPPPAQPLIAVVDAVHPAGLLDSEEGGRRHILRSAPDGDAAVLRVYAGDRPVLSEAAFAARRASVEGSLGA